MTHRNKLLILATALLLLPLTSDALACKRCTRSYYHTLTYARNWSSDCYSCHQSGCSGSSCSTYSAAPKVGWREALTKVIQDQEENRAFIAAISAMGPSDPIVQQAATQYGGAYGGNTSVYSTYTPQAAQGTTQYGYSSLSGDWGNIPLATSYDQLGRLADKLIDGANLAHSNFAGVIDDTQAGQIEVAKILAKGQAASQLARAIEVPPTPQGARTFSYQSQLGPAAAVPPPPWQTGPPGPPAVQSQFTQAAVSGLPLTVQDVISNRCVRCHSGPTPKAGLDMIRWPSFDLATRNAIVSRLTTDTPGQPRMPLSPDGGPGQPLSADELRAFLCDPLPVQPGQ